MKLTDDVKLRLELLKGKTYIWGRFEVNSLIPLKSVRVMRFLSYETRKKTIKPVFGKEKEIEYVVRFNVMNADHLGTNFIGAHDYNLPFVLQSIENGRQVWEQIKLDIEKFGFEITKKNDK